MRQVGTADLKNNLSAYLQKVRRGARFLVTDRGRPVAKLIPTFSKEKEETLDEKLAAMAAEGILTLPKEPNKPFHRFKPINVGKGNLGSQIIIQDREDREQSILSGFKRPR